MTDEEIKGIEKAVEVLQWILKSVKVNSKLKYVIIAEEFGAKLVESKDIDSYSDYDYSIYHASDLMIVGILSRGNYRLNDA